MKDDVQKETCPGCGDSGYFCQYCSDPVPVPECQPVAWLLNYKHVEGQSVTLDPERASKAADGRYGSAFVTPLYASPQGPTEAEVNALEAIWLEINKATESPRSSDCVLALAIIKRRIGRIRSHRGRRNEAQSISQRLYQSRNCE